MKGRKSFSYINYGPIPQNEYTTTNQRKSENTAAVLEYNAKPGDTAHEQRLMKRQALHPSGRRKIRGWARSQKANGWRAESASLQDEFTDMERDSG